MDGAGPRLPRAARVAQARDRDLPAARASRPRVVVANVGGWAGMGVAPPLVAVDQPRHRHGGREAVSGQAPGTGRHLLAINFRDPAHPEAGGAELHLEEILLEAVRRGWRVTWLVSGF